MEKFFIRVEANFSGTRAGTLRIEMEKLTNLAC